MPLEEHRYFMTLGPAGESRVYYRDGRLVGPSDFEKKGKRMENESMTANEAKRRIAALERRVRELGGTPRSPEDVELPFAVQELWGDDAEPTAENESDDLGFEVRDLWGDD